MTPSDRTVLSEGNDGRLSQPPSAAFGLDEAAILPCLSAAKGLGLVLRRGHDICKVSRRFPNEGWWGRKSYGASMDLGGPWSVEFVFRLCELGLLSLDPQSATAACLTKAGRAYLRAAVSDAAPQARTAPDAELGPGSTQNPTQQKGE